LSHNPSFKSVTRQTTSRDLVKYYTDRRKVIVDCLLSTSSIVITSDIWFGNAKEDYLSVVAHYINKDWLLEKRIIGLRLIESAHTGENIADHIFAVIDDFGCTNKVISITLDNASSNSKAMEKCHTPFREIGNEASIRVPRMFKSHAWQQYDKQMQCY
jgi:hypothetical protein